MFGVRILTGATAYAVILLEVYSGVINGPLWWVLPGALVLSLLAAVSLIDMASGAAKPAQGVVAAAVQWIMILATSLAAAYVANYFGREMIPDLLQNRMGG